MNYYIFVKEDLILGKGQCKNLTEGVLNLEVDFEIYNDIEKYIYKNGELVLNPNYEAKQAQKEAERIANLYLTGADVERGIYQVIGMDFDDILTYITELKPEGIDIKALKIELKANHFYRGNPYIDIIGELLGFSKKQLDKFFETNDPQCLKK